MTFLMASYSPEDKMQELEDENKSLKYKNEKLSSIVTKAWHIINMLEKKDISPEIKAAIKTWQFQQSKA